MTDAPLRATGITVQYGGLRALDDVSLEVPAGAIVGLIGPNGAGKTTFFDCVTGIVRPAAGRVVLFGHDVTDWPVHRRVRLGVGRTFQRLELFGSLTVTENLLVALESTSTVGGLRADVLRGRASVETRATAERHAAEIIERFGLEEHAQTRAADLPMGLSRICEVARALCTGPRLLLLDEPSSGLNADETARLADVLRDVRGEGERSLLVVEHDMAFVLGLSDAVHVLDFGRRIASGTPEQIRADLVVRAAYLGEEIEDGIAP